MPEKYRTPPPMEVVPTVSIYAIIPFYSVSVRIALSASA
jgi:hypothetical protein